MVKISGLITGLILVSLCAGVFGLFMAGANSSYPQPNFDNSTLSAFNKLAELQNQSNVIKKSTEQAQQPTGIIDVIGAYVSQGYQALKISTSAFDLFFSMLDSAANKLGISSIAMFTVAISTIMIILIFIAIIISALVKKDV